LISKLFCTKCCTGRGGGGLLEGVGPEKIETFSGPEMATSETHVHKITNVLVPFLYGAWT
jgi:hypothetical protein